MLWLTGSFSYVSTLFLWRLSTAYRERARGQMSVSTYGLGSVYNHFSFTKRDTTLRPFQIPWLATSEDSFG